MTLTCEHGNPKNRCEFCPPGSDTANDAVPLMMLGAKGGMLVKYLGLNEMTKVCEHCLRCKLKTIEQKGCSDEV